MKTMRTFRVAAAVALCALLGGTAAAGQAITPAGRSAAGTAAVALKPTPPVTYSLSTQQLAGLPPGLALNGNNTPGQPRRLHLLSSLPAAGGSGPLFAASAPWTFLPDARFQQVDGNGNRLLLGPGGKADLADRSGAPLGSLQDPGLTKLYERLLALTM